MIIYKITNKLNGKSYIGQTIKSVEVRFKQHCKTESILGRAIRKYGENNFEIETLQKAKSKEEMDLLEKEYIEKYDSFKNGYNVTEDGQGTFDNKKSRWILKKETHDKLLDENFVYFAEIYKIIKNLNRNGIICKNGKKAKNWTKVFELSGITITNKRKCSLLKKELIDNDILRKNEYIEVGNSVDFYY